ncbi:MAG: AAA family ATPase, partial [Clostridia bacterium]|nr:AAA family ATPase [Clostridia bacterium]
KHPQQEFIQIDTSNILFILGGAFDGIEKTVEKRMSSGAMGFGNEVKSKKDMDQGEMYRQVVPQDLVKFGLIPELVGRMPVITALQPLDAPALVKILSKPKNAILKQYTGLFKLDDVELEFAEDALLAVAEKTLQRNTGARGLRSVMEEVLTNLMFEVPSDPAIEKIVITRACVEEKAPPELIKNPERKPNRIKARGKKLPRRKVTA